jgi:hypothetical protein
VPNHRGYALWFVLPIILFVAAFVVGTNGPQDRRLIGAAVAAALGVAVIVVALTRVIRSIEFCDDIVVHYAVRDRHIPWDHLAFLSFHEAHSHMRTGIPLVSIPTETHTMTLRFRDGKEITSHIDPDCRRPVATLVQKRATLDFAGEQKVQQANARSEARHTYIAAILFGIFACGCGLCLTYFKGQDMMRGLQSTTWPTARGTLISAGMGSETQSNDRGRPTQVFFPVVRYRFRVDDKAYTGDRFQFWVVKSADADSVRQSLKDAVPGPEVTVHFKPDDPAISVVVPGLGGWGYGVLIATVLMIVGGPIFSFVQFRRLRRTA